MRQFSYAMKLAADKRDGGYVVTCRDLPEAIAQGDTLKEALSAAADCLEEAIAARIDDAGDIPSPSAAKRGERMVDVPTSTALKAAVYLAAREAGVGNSELARRGLEARAKVGSRQGFPVFQVPKGAARLTPEDVRRDEDKG